MVSRRGLSQVVSVVVLIALTISLVAGVFVIAKNYVTTGLGKAGACINILEKVSLNPDYTCYDPTSNSTLFSISRNEFALESLLVSVTYESLARNFRLTDKLKNIANLTNYGSNITVEITNQSIIGITSNSNSTGGINPVTLTIPITVSGENRFLLVCIPFENKKDKKVTSVSYGATPLEKIDFIRNKNDSKTELCGLISPNLGTSEVVIDLTLVLLDRGATAGVYALSGVNQTSPYREPIPPGSSVNGNPLNVTITGQAGDLFIDCAGSEQSGGGDSFSMSGPNETNGRFEAFNFKIGHYYGASSYMNGSASETMGWTIGDTGQGATAMGIAIKPSSSTSVIQVVGEQMVSLPGNESGKSYCLAGKFPSLKIEIAPKVGGTQCSVVDSLSEIPICRSELTCI